MGNPKKWGLHNTRTEYAQHGIRKTGAERAQDKLLCEDPDASEVNYKLKPKRSQEWELRASRAGPKLGFRRYPTKRSAIDAAERMQKKNKWLRGPYEKDIVVVHRKSGEHVVVTFKKEIEDEQV